MRTKIQHYLNCCRLFAFLVAIGVRKGTARKIALVVEHSVHPVIYKEGHSFGSISLKNALLQYHLRFSRLVRASFLVCLSACLLTSCASVSTPQRTETETTGNLRWADYTGKVKKMWDLNFSVSAIDGKERWEYWTYDPQREKYDFQIIPGPHTIDVTATWSNRCKDTTSLPLDVKEGVKYVVYAYELQEGQDPNAPIAIPETGKEEYKVAGGSTFRDITWENAAAFITHVGIIYPPSLILGLVFGAMAARERHSRSGTQKYEANRNSNDDTATTNTQPTDTAADTVAQPPDSSVAAAAKPEDTPSPAVSAPPEPPPAPTARPFDGCCYVWMEDAATREIVAGTRPPGVGK